MHRADAVALLDGELLGIANLGDAVGERGRDRERRDFVLDVGDLVALDHRRRQCARTRPRAHRPARRSAPRSSRSRSSAPIRRSTSTNPKRVGIQRQRFDREIGAGRDQRADDEERSRRRISRDLELERFRRALAHAHAAICRPRWARRARQASVRNDRDSPPVDWISVTPDACRPASISADFTCALATGRSWCMPCSSPPRITMGANDAVVTTVERRTHRPQRTDHAAHRALPQRRVAGHHREERPPGERTREDAHRRAAVAAVEDVLGLAQASIPPPLTVTAFVPDRIDTPNASRALRVACTSSPVARLVERAASVRERGEQQRAVRDRLVARQPEPPAQRAGTPEGELLGERHARSVRDTW